jgi:hypothetical protein
MVRYYLAIEAYGSDSESGSGEDQEAGNDELR